MERLAAALEISPGLLQLEIDLGYMARPRIAPWAAQGVYIIARPWPPGGTLFSKNDFTLDFAHGTVSCPNGAPVPMVPGKTAPFPASTCDACPLRAQCTTAKPEQGRTLTIRKDEPFPPTLRAKRSTQRGRAALRQRTAVEHAISHQVAQQAARPLQGAAQEPV